MKVNYVIADDEPCAIDIDGIGLPIGRNYRQKVFIVLQYANLKE